MGYNLLIPFWDQIQKAEASVHTETKNKKFHNIAGCPQIKYRVYNVCVTHFSRIDPKRSVCLFMYKKLFKHDKVCSLYKAHTLKIKNQILAMDLFLAGSAQK